MNQVMMLDIWLLVKNNIKGVGIVISPQEAYDILFKNGYIGKLKSAIDVGDKYIFVFNSITQKKNDIPITGRFRTAVDKRDGSISLYDILSNRSTKRTDVTNNIISFYDRKITL